MQRSECGCSGAAFCPEPSLGRSTVALIVTARQWFAGISWFVRLDPFQIPAVTRKPERNTNPLIACDRRAT